MPCYDCHVPSAKAIEPQRRSAIPGQISVALVGNPNVGKTSLFNCLTGLRARTANISGTTVERSASRIHLGSFDVEVVDLPGVYSLAAATPEEHVTNDYLLGHIPGIPQPDLVVVIADATNLERSLFLIGQVLEKELPVVIALNMMDIAQRKGVHVDVARLSQELGCPVIPTVARVGRGIGELKEAMANFPEIFPVPRPQSIPAPVTCGGCNRCPFQERYTWSEKIAANCVRTPTTAWGHRSESIDRFLAHPVFGVFAFIGVMLTVFYLIFSVANIPMALMDTLFGRAGTLVATVIPAGKLQSLIVDGIIGGVGGMLVFLPQICILFFFLALLEDSGYLARAAFVMDRLMRHFGLPGTAFVPMLSAHACAIPAIMATRVIRDKRDRLLTILVLPLMTCSARIPVYVMVTAMLFPDAPGKAAVVFAGGYCLGIVAALTMAILFKYSILPGDSKPLVLELPDYRLPSIKNALIYSWDRGRVFVMQAGTIILLISVVLWTLATFPESDPPAAAVRLKQEAKLVAGQGDAEKALELLHQADNVTSQSALFNSFAGRIGQLIEPVVRPLGFDWQIGVGIISSFAAREVIVSTLAIVYGVGKDEVEGDTGGFYTTLSNARRSDGTLVFTAATSMSLMVFYVLAMQCLPTQAITRRETNSWKWPVFQLVYMTVLAYVASFITYQVLHRFNFG